ncbi:trigger factor [Synechococcus sp. PCC 7335]|uniref:trigger factor n=1 Tax=Synechococcus sp. (strain ATCC 29403 / PCC 7335) TaxID=91464 RepID=UPI00017EDD46|nr:trigger factor [Synechococcus sp. PCC 7335]EDX86844.1 trigger factor [Synechococcus sp. PCC 7335]
MKVTQENLPDSQVGLEIEVPAELSKQGYEKVLRDYMKSANIPGFRKGKVPRQILIQRIGAVQLKAAALEDMLQTVIEKAIKQEEIEALGNYQLQSDFESLVSSYTPGEPFVIKASVDVPPRVALSKYKDLSVKAEEVKPKDSRVDETIEGYRENLATLVPVEDRTAKEGDVTVVDFVGKAANESGELEEFEGGSAQDFQVEIKEGRFIPGFVEGIVGMKLEESKEVEVTFPEDYPQAELAGKPATFEITLKELKEKELPDLDDDFAEEVSEFETLEELRQSLEERYQEEAIATTDRNIEEALLNELVKHVEAEIPKSLVMREVDFIVTQTVMQLSRQGIDINQFLTKELVDNMRESSKPEAIERLRRTLALGEIAKQESIAVTDEEVTERTEEMMAEVDDPSQVDPERLNQVVNEDLLKEKILAWLKENSEIELVPEGSLAPEETPEDPSESADTDAESASVSAPETEEIDTEPIEAQAVEVEVVDD